MDRPDFASMTQPLLEALRQRSVSTEQQYGRLVDHFSELIRQLDTQFGLGASEAATARRRETVERSLAELRRVARDYEPLVARKLDHGRSLVQTVARQTDALRALSADAEQIRECSLDLELLSLNAMVAALKAGTQGKGFATITTELKLLANATNDLTHGLSQRQAEINADFEGFRARWTALEAEEARAGEAFRDQVAQIVSRHESAGETFFARLADIQRRAAEVKDVFFRIIVEIQNQDRIRQSLDHVMLSLGQLRSLNPDDPVDSRLDEVTFFEAFPPLCRMVLDDVAGQLEHDLGVFRDAVGQSRALVDRLQSEQRQLLSGELDRHRDDNLSAAFATAEATLGRLEADTRQWELGGRALTGVGESLQKKAVGLSAALSAFVPLIEQFRVIDLMARIHVAKITDIEGIQNSVSAMSELIVHLARSVTVSQDSRRQFAADVHALLERFETDWGGDSRDTGELVERLSRLVAEIRSVQQGLLDDVAGSDQFARAFEAALEAAGADLAALDRVHSQWAPLTQNLDELALEMTRWKDQWLREKGVADWPLDGERLRVVTEGFTIFTHKKWAAGWGQFTVEKGGEPGDVLLF